MTTGGRSRRASLASARTARIVGASLTVAASWQAPAFAAPAKTTTAAAAPTTTKAPTTSAAAKAPTQAPAPTTAPPTPPIPPPAAATTAPATTPATAAPIPAPADDTRASATAAPPLPDPETWHQEPPTVAEDTRTGAYAPLLELGVDGGVVSRPSTGDRVHYDIAGLFGLHARVDLTTWLAARLHARFEESAASFDDGALHLPSGTTYDTERFHGVTLGAAAEPTWTPLSCLDLWAGLGIGWGRTTADPWRTSGAESVALPTRAAVFIELPASLGLRVRVVPDRLVLNLSGQASLLTNQSGSLELPYRTPGASGRLTTVEAFPTFGTSLAVLAGVGILL